MTQRQGLWITCVLALLWLMYFFGPALWHPDDYWFGGVGDGAKNYYTFAYHVKHDDTWLHFNGCNYPTGDHVTFTDGHPILSFLVGWLPWVKQYPVGTINVFMMLGLWFAWILIYLVLVRWHCSPWFAMMASVVVIMGQPQLERINGHFSLAAVWVIPLTIYLLDHWRTSQRLMYLIFGAALQVFVWFLHPYLGLMVSGMMILYPLIERFINKTSGRGVWWSVALSFVVIVGYLALVKSTDVITDRPEGGKGFFEFLTSFKLLFGGMHGNLIGQWFGEFRQDAVNGEGKAYIGLVIMLSLLIIAIALAWKRSELIRHWRSVAPWLIVALLFLAFAAGVPFIWGWEEGVQMIPYLEHFRSPGRFVWVFHFVVVIGSLSVVYFIFKDHRKWCNYGIALAAVVAVVDHWAHQQQVRAIVQSTPNYFDPQFLTAKDASDINEIKNSEQSYNALWTIPQICYGSDIYTRYFQESDVRRAYVVSFHTGLPLLGTINPRSGLSDARMTMQMTAPNVFEKEMWSKFGPETCFYLLQLQDPLFDSESRLTNRSSSRICIADEIAEWESWKKKRKETSNAKLLLDNMPQTDGDGNLLMQQDMYHGLASIHTDTLTSDIPVQVSAWLEMASIDTYAVGFAVDEIDPSGEKREVFKLYSNEVSYQFGKKVWLNAFFTMHPKKEYVVYLECPRSNQKNVRLYDFKLYELEGSGMERGDYQGLWKELEEK